MHAGEYVPHTNAAIAASAASAGRRPSLACTEECSVCCTFPVAVSSWRALFPRYESARVPRPRPGQHHPTRRHENQGNKVISRYFSVALSYCMLISAGAHRRDEWPSEPLLSGWTQALGQDLGRAGRRGASFGGARPKMNSKSQQRWMVVLFGWWCMSRHDARWRQKGALWAINHKEDSN